MRLTNNMLINNFMYNIGRNMSRMDKIQLQMSTGKKIQTPGDDPITASRALKFKTDVSEIQQYQKNVDDTMAWMEMSEKTMDNLDDLFQRARELTVQAANGGSISTEDKQKIAAEIEQIKNQVIGTANTSYAGRYLFSGFKTDKPLLNGDGSYGVNVVNSGTDREDINYEVSISDSLNINILGSELFDYKFDPLTNTVGQRTITNAPADNVVGQKPQIILDLENLKTAMDSNNQAAIQQGLTNIDRGYETILKAKADLGARYNRVELTKNRLEADETNTTKLLSLNEDADMSEVIMNLKNEENVYNASLASGARIIQPTLIDFLR